LKKQTHSTMLWLNSNKAEDKISLIKYSSELTVSKAIEGDQLSTLKKVNELETFRTITGMLKELEMSLNLTSKLTEYQAIEIPILVCQKYYYLKLDELILVFRKAKTGDYGKVFNRLDIQVICEWIEAYIVSEERTAYFEKVNTAHKIKNDAPLTDIYKNYSVENLKTEPQKRREAYQKKVDEFFKSRKND
jgi:hypothetical protein